MACEVLRQIHLRRPPGESCRASGVGNAEVFVSLDGQRPFLHKSDIELKARSFAAASFLHCLQAAHKDGSQPCSARS